MFEGTLRGFATTLVDDIATRATVVDDIDEEIVDAIVREIQHVACRTCDPIESEQINAVESTLIDQAIADSSPAEIIDRARAIAIEHTAADAAPESDATPAAEDPALNEVGYATTLDGRLRGEFDLDAVIAERLVSAARLQWMGPISDFAVKMATCDTAVTGIGHDLNGAPLDVSATRRLFTGAIRKQIEWRDQCCVKCGAPASWTDCHHIVQFADGGPTTVDNGCLLCRACRTAVHHFSWDIVMGHDRHPWLIPPASVDPRRRPQPGYNQRTMRLDDIPAAA